MTAGAGLMVRPLVNSQPIFTPGQQLAGQLWAGAAQLWGTWVGERTGGPVVAVALGAGQHLCRI